MRAHHHSNTKRGGVCMYCKNYVPIIRRADLSDLQKYNPEITIDKERCLLACLYRSPSQNDGELEAFCSDQTFLLNNINNFNHHVRFFNKGGIVLEDITSTAGYNQIINEPTHFINVSSCCIELILY